jgi:hypothetical protein
LSDVERFVWILRKVQAAKPRNGAVQVTDENLFPALSEISTSPKPKSMRHAAVAAWAWNQTLRSPRSRPGGGNGSWGNVLDRLGWQVSELRSCLDRAAAANATVAALLN